ncbi:MAG: MOSC domain-containing protein [Gemmatimonadaceae bacterium]|nr:MOSC domain-containing protein [Gemmatimonadaceae bacterium]
MVARELGRGRIESINISSGGVPKKYVFVVNVLKDRIEGDDQLNKLYHGGPERAVCLFSRELIDELVRDGHPIAPGSTGENLTISGLTWSEIVPGIRLRVGSVLLEVASYTSPCKKIGASFLENYFNRISQKLFPGWSRLYARVLVTGQLQVGDEVVVEHSMAKSVSDT